MNDKNELTEINPAKSNIVFSAQPGKQSDFLSTTADICIYGGAAGGGKTYGLLLDVVRNCINFKSFNAAIFRRKATDLKKPGAIWDESKKIYPVLGGRPNNQELSWRFNKNSKIKFSGLQYDNDIYAWQGAQLDFLGFDELTHFTESQFWYLIGRMRSVTGNIRPYARATCNPENNWVFEFIKWWIGEDGNPIESRSGVIRWFYRYNDDTFWFDSEQIAKNDIYKKELHGIKPMSFTFIPANINDNPILLANNPNYYATLAQLPEDEKKKLLEGNWIFRPPGKLFKGEDFRLFAVMPPDPDYVMIFVDTASKIETAHDYTIMQVWVRWKNCIYLKHQVRGKFKYGLQKKLLASLIYDHKPDSTAIEEMGNGFCLVEEIKDITGSLIIPITRSKDKYTRGYQVQDYVQSGYVYLNPQSDYYVDFITECTQFSPENKNKKKIHDDQVDCMLDAVYYLLIQKIKKVESQADLRDFYESSKSPVWA